MPKNKSNKSRVRRGRERHLSVRSDLRAEPDLHKIARAVVALAMAQAEKEAQAAKEADATTKPDAGEQGRIRGGPDSGTGVSS